jgi:hypothetical protein
VTITGSGFGTTQGSGNVWLGSTYGVVTTWSDTQVIATVAAGSQTGTAKIFQYGVWSNALDFTVETPPPATGVILTPSAVSMAVEETRTLQAADVQGQPFQGLVWSSSDPTVASLSTDDPPVITALAPGHTTITAGDGSADVTVYPGPTLPTGTIKWSIPGDGSGVTQILPAVPSETGVADVFALQSSGKLMAVTADGFVPWTANVGMNKSLLPDFQGGLVLADQQSVGKLDGLTGQAKPGYSYSHPPSFGSSPTTVHTDGTIFTVDGDSLVGINPQTGVPKFGIAMENSVYDQLPFCEFPVANHTVSPPTIYQLVIAGDGNAYIAYSYSNDTSDPQIIGNCNAGYDYRDFHLRVLRVAVDGSSQKTSVGDWTQNTTCSPNSNGQTFCSTEGSIPFVNGASIITNADNGILLTWIKSTNFTSNDPVAQLTPISASGAGTTASMTGYVQPMVQQQDGTFVGTLYNTQQNLAQMISFDQAGNVKWSATGNYQPQVATSDGGVIAQNLNTGASATFDSNGTSTGQMASLPTQSWSGNVYKVGSVDQVAVAPVQVAASFWPVKGANVSANSAGGIIETLYVRSFAPWEWFGPEVEPFPCAFDCFLGNDRSFTTSTDPSVTSKVTGIVKFLVPGMVVVDTKVYSDISHDVYGRSKVGHPKIKSTSKGDGNLHMEFAGANPLVPGSPDIDTKLDMSGQVNSQQVCYSGHLYGDAFPNAEAFVINSHMQALMLLTFATDADRNIGPFTRLPGSGTIDMGSFSNLCLVK